MQWAVFSGAGLSAPELPTGFRMRDDLLALLHEAAATVAPQVVDEAYLNTMIGRICKLEVVLGRLWGTVGDVALECLQCLRHEAPNTAHLLAAAHLAHGGLHVTVNFDIGIELAYEKLMTDERFRGLRPARPTPLRVVASHAEFHRWANNGRPPALL